MREENHAGELPESPPTPKSAIEVLPVSVEEFVRKSSLSATRRLGDKLAEARQQLQLLQRREARASLQDVIAIGKLADEVGLTSIPLTSLQLRGALALIVKEAMSASGLATYEAAGKAWVDSRRPAREPGLLAVFISAATIGPELAEAGRSLRLRRVSVPRGLGGRLDLVTATDLGRRFSATVQVAFGDAEFLIVNSGVVDTDLLSLLEAEMGGTAPKTGTVAADPAETTGMSEAGSEAPGAEGATQEEAPEVKSPSAVEPILPRHPARPSLQRRGGIAV